MPAPTPAAGNRLTPTIPRRRSVPKAATLLTLQQAHAEFGPPYTSLRDLCLRGVLPFVRFEGSARIWVRRSDVEALIERSTERSGR